jgi:hypothetical protein
MHVAEPPMLKSVGMVPLTGENAAGQVHELKFDQTLLRAELAATTGKVRFERSSSGTRGLVQGRCAPAQSTESAAVFRTF